MSWAKLIVFPGKKQLSTSVLVKIESHFPDIIKRKLLRKCFSELQLCILTTFRLNIKTVLCYTYIKLINFKHFVVLFNILHPVNGLYLIFCICWLQSIWISKDIDWQNRGNMQKDTIREWKNNTMCK